MNSTQSSHTDVLLAGGLGQLGARIAVHLRRRAARVKAVVRAATPPARTRSLEEAGVEVLRLDMDDAAAMTAAAAGTACVVSALNGLAPTILGTQGTLLRAAVAAGVPRFIPSDFSLDFTRTAAGRNRNLDLRRDFHKVLDTAPIGVTSILNGAFGDLLTGPAPFILFPIRRVLAFGDPRQPLDFTTVEDTAAFTAAAALDPTTPRVLRIAGDQLSAVQLAEVASLVTGERFKVMRAGGLSTLGGLIHVARLVAPGRGEVFPPWQGMQYMRDMFSGAGKLAPLDNHRYPGLRWTTARDVLAGR